MRHPVANAVFLAFRGVRYPGGVDIEVAWKEVPIPQRRGNGEEPVDTILRVERVKLGKDPQTPLPGLFHVLHREVAAGYLEEQLERYRRERRQYGDENFQGPQALRLPHPLNDGAVLVAGALDLLLEGLDVPLFLEGTRGYPEVLEGDTVLRLNEFGAPVLIHKDGRRERPPVDAAQFFNLILDGAVLETWTAIALLAIRRA